MSCRDTPRPSQALSADRVDRPAGRGSSCPRSPCTKSPSHSTYRCGSGSLRPSSSVIWSRCSSVRERRDRLDRITGQELEQDGDEERHDDQHNDELHDASQNASQTVLLSVPARPRRDRSFGRLLAHPHARDRVTGRETRERAAAVGQCRSEHAVHVGLTGDGPDRVARPRGSTSCSANCLFRSS